MDLTKVPSPCYVMEEELLRKNLSLIKNVAESAGFCHVEVVSYLQGVYQLYHCKL